MVNKLNIADIRIKGEKYLVRLDTLEVYKNWHELKIVSDRDGQILRSVCVGEHSQYNFRDKVGYDYQCLCSNHDTNKPNIAGSISGGSDEASFDKFWSGDES